MFKEANTVTSTQPSWNSGADFWHPIYKTSRSLGYYGQL